MPNKTVLDSPLPSRRAKDFLQVILRDSGPHSRPSCVVNDRGRTVPSHSRSSCQAASVTSTECSSRAFKMHEFGPSEADFTIRRLRSVLETEASNCDWPTCSSRTETPVFKYGSIVGTGSRYVLRFAASRRADHDHVVFLGRGCGLSGIRTRSDKASDRQLTSTSRY
ncbi:hypothetical protein Poly41_57920 [Novipirellula artificiosorum]|uniref:Uncharacterized protein n=1 Tax=Novipirellula artificiosorum TaxID=2528016 RepID=A0A5C6DAN5_9BACT|nr:hypothetical protein Poly41_57920 [Novipirellula artificiosorum]